MKDSWETSYMSWAKNQPVSCHDAESQLRSAFRSGWEAGNRSAKEAIEEKDIDSWTNWFINESLLGED